MRSLMDICANVIVRHKSLLQDVLELDKIHVDIFDCIKNAMKNRKSCSKSYKKHFSTSYKLPYSIVLASSPPSEKCIGNEDVFWGFDDFTNSSITKDDEQQINTLESEMEELWWEVEMDQSS
jgi:hypothetical protein